MVNMPVAFSLQFDGGENTFTRGIATALDGVKNFEPLWKKVVSWFEGDNSQGKSPILDIWETKGAAIGSDWSNRPSYDAMKSKVWSDMRVYNVPINGMWEQVLSGLQLSGLLSQKAPNAVREYAPFALVYGINTDYSARQQEKKKILDVSKYMDNGLGRILAAYVREISGASE